MNTISEIVIKLEQWGAMPHTALERVLGDQECYNQLLQEFGSDPAFLNLEKEVRDREPKDAYMVVHTLKGAAKSLDLIPLSRVLGELTECLRELADGGIRAQEAPERIEFLMEEFSLRKKEYLNMIGIEK